MKTIRGADEWWLCILLGESYETKFQSGGGVHVYDGNCDEVLSYMAGVGWHEKKSKAVITLLLYGRTEPMCRSV